MDANDALRRYLEQRREQGESELVLDSLTVEDAMKLLGAARIGKKEATPRSTDWRAAIRAAGGAPEAETYDPVSRTFTIVAGEARMAGQFSAVAPLQGGGALVTGGYGNGTGPRASAWVYRP